MVALFAWWWPQAPDGDETRSTGRGEPSPSTSPGTAENSDELLVSFQGMEPGDSIETMPNAVLDVQVEYRNLSGKHQKNVSLHVGLPSEMTLVRGTERILNTSNVNGRLLDAELTGPGVDIGGYLPEGNAFVVFSIRVDGPDSFTCNPRTLTPQVVLTSGGETVSDELITRVVKRC
ncbi:hypothetical protein [Actinophytocola sp.]|uniref:hypothetical protein n=1 Tax=Actinophytocola sp. TaxID=1872138 RepID=UPI002D80627F|nr:hypothetical protein [Actinophytocola sp.]HET9139785.1 hypothetical protein [Actinophytocola sp.]